MRSQPLASLLEVRNIVGEGLHTLVLEGELDLASAGGLEATVLKLGTEGPDAIELDLSGLTFMDVRGLQAVLCARDVCRYHDRRFWLIAGSSHVQRVFELTGLLGTLPFREAEPLGHDACVVPDQPAATVV